MSTLKRRVYITLSVILIFIGTTHLISSFSSMTGYVIVKGLSKPLSSAIGAFLVVFGLALLRLSKKRKKGQSSMEFMMTYGWALLAAILSISFLAAAGVFNVASFSPNACVLFPPFSCEEFIVTETGVSVIIRNLGDSSIDVSEVTITNCGSNLATKTIAKDGTEQINIGCSDVLDESFKGDMSMVYKESSKILDKTVEGSLAGSVQEGGVPLDTFVSLPLDNSGGLYEDESGNHDGSCSNCPTLTTGPSGNPNSAAEFSGSESITIADNQRIRLVGDVTFSFWVRPTSLSSGTMSLIYKADCGEFAVYSEPNEGLTYSHGSCSGQGSGTQIFWPRMFSEDEWVHVVLVRDVSEQTVTSYKNGVLKGTGSSNGQWQSPSSSSLDILIGTSPSGDDFTGSLQGLSVYDRALSDEEVMLLYGS